MTSDFTQQDVALLRRAISLQREYCDEKHGGGVPPSDITDCDCAETARAFEDLAARLSARLAAAPSHD